jgi:hypothetical protein
LISGVGAPTLACEQPELADDIVFGAAAGVLLDEMFAT